MKKIIRAVVITASIIVILINWSAISSAAGRVSGKLLFVVHVAGLYSKSPNQTLEMPVQGISKSQVGDSWHVPREGDRLHEGQDIFVKRGTLVLSATEGYIVRIGKNTLGGQTVSVLGAGGRIYYYAHLDSYAPNISVGDHVTTETVLGYVGTSGNAAGTPPHLHFGVYAQGGAINPLPMLIDRPAETSSPDKPVTKRVKKDGQMSFVARDRLLRSRLLKRAH
jgi:murein DD-endopeptidase MepM/ murein hydrolase activator NlpD